MRKFPVFICLLLCASACGGASETAVESTTTQASTITSGFTSTTLPQTTTTTTAMTMATTTTTSGFTSTTLPQTTTTTMATTTTTTATPTTTVDLNETVATPNSEWKPGKYLDRHCESLEEEDDGCRADLMMEIGMGAEVVRHPDSSEQLYGVSQYLRIFDFMEDNPATGQFGLWGQWIGSLGAHPNGAFNSIEGGLFIHDKMGRSKFPKYMASAATHLYSSDSDTGGGWGFHERRIDCSVLGRITIANRMIVPPNLIAFDEDQETHESEGGIFVGTSWVALPLINGSPRVDGPPKSTDEGLMTWTFVIDADNYSGPLIAYLPEHWSRRLDRWNAMEILDDVYESENEGWDLESPLAKTLIDFLDGEVSNSQLHSIIEDEEWYGGWGGDKEFGSPHWVRKEDTLGYSPARGYIPTGIEMPPIPTFKVETPDGRIFLKIFPPQIPNETISEAFVLNVQTFDVNLYNHFLKTFQQSDDASNFNINFDGLGIPMQVEGWDENPWEGIELIDLETFEDPYEANLELRVPLLPVNKNGETNILFNWQKDQKSERGWSNYFEVKNGVPIPVSENEVPEQIKQLEYETLRHPTSLMSHENVTDQWFDSSCFTCVGTTGCDATKYQTLLDDGSRITYRWYRFMDQPAFDHLSIEYPEKYSDDSLNELQKVVEAIHREWGSDHKLIERPIAFDNNNLAEVDHGLIVEPPPGKEIGWVPIVLEVEIPDGIWQEEIDAPRWKEGKFYPR